VRPLLLRLRLFTLSSLVFCSASLPGHFSIYHVLIICATTLVYPRQTLGSSSQRCLSCTCTLCLSCWPPPLQCSPFAAPAHLAFGNFCMAFRLRYHSGTHWPFIVPLDLSLFLVIALVLHWKSLLFAFFQKQAAFVSDWTFLHLGWAQLVAQRSLLFVGRGVAASMIVLLVTLTNHTMTRAPIRAACLHRDSDNPAPRQPCRLFHRIVKRAPAN
jgi:hypothetical protein